MTEQITLVESAGEATTLSKGRYHAKLISADSWGSTAYYPRDVLARDGSRVFHKGVKMYQDHLTESEQFERPEGSVANLVGKLISDSQFEESGDDGPGLYADVEFYPSYIDRISELKEDVGLSIRADGLTEIGERDGRVGPVLVGMLRADSVDVVTQAGVGGRLTRMLEADRGKAGRPVEKESHPVTNVTKEEFDAFKAEISEQLKNIPDQVKEAVKASTVTPVYPDDPQAGELPDPLARAKEGHNVTEGQITTHEFKPGGSVVENPLPEPEKVVEALRHNDLPAEAATGLYASLRKGTSLEDAIAEQIKLREAYVGSVSETGVLHLRESNNDGDHGAARAVARLGAGQRTTKIRG